MADIQSPDFDTRLAILAAKTDSLNLKIPPEILEFLAANIQSNIRELEGGLKQVVNLMVAQNGNVSLQDVKKIFFGNRYLKHSQPADPRDIVKAVCNFYNLREADLIGKRRTQALVIPRQVTMFLLRNVGQLPLIKVGDLLGGKDHTTVMHGVSKIEKLLGNGVGGEQLRSDLTNIQKRLELPRESGW